MLSDTSMPSVGGNTGLKTYTVSQINRLVKAAIGAHLPERLIVRAQISGWKRHSSGHCYFSLKEEKAILPAVMWKSQFARLKFVPEEGMEILATGNVDVYEPRGVYQFYAEKLEPLGVGALQIAFEQMVAKLQREGLFEEEHKKPLPAYPQRIGILTSETGAAIDDIARSIFDRWPLVDLFLFPVPVQGEEAGHKIAKTLNSVNRNNRRYGLDLLIVGRGGGSLEDLWAFNEEILARAIFASKIPVISAVGHEVDVTVADYVADARASTPTKAGVVAVPDRAEIIDKLDHWQQRLKHIMTGCITLRQANLQALVTAALFKRPITLLQNKQQQLDELAQRVYTRMTDRIHRHLRQLSQYYEHINRLEPHRLLGRQAQSLDRLSASMQTAVSKIMHSRKMQLETLANRLAGLDPRSVLHRGYSMTLHAPSGRLVRRPEDVRCGDRLITELANDHRIESEVTFVPKAQVPGAQVPKADA